MYNLNLPSYNFKIKTEEGKQFIFDEIRKKHLVLTPEEWVRQNFIRYLIEAHDYPKSLFSCESGLKYNKLSKRTDIVVYDRNGKTFFLIECKAPEVKINQKVFRQVAVYNQTIKAPYICVTNGLEHFICAIDHENNSYNFLQDMPQL